LRRRRRCDRSGGAFRTRRRWGRGVFRSLFRTWHGRAVGTCAIAREIINRAGDQEQREQAAQDGPRPAPALICHWDDGAVHFFDFPPLGWCARAVVDCHDTLRESRSIVRTDAMPCGGRSSTQPQSGLTSAQPCGVVMAWMEVARRSISARPHPSSGNPLSSQRRNALNAALSVRPRIEIEISGTNMSTVWKLRPARTSR
jgi:hypothetical protein